MNTAPEAAPPKKERRAKAARPEFFAGLRSSFIAGVVVLAPIGITASLVYWFVTGPMAKVDSFVKHVIPGAFGGDDAAANAVPGLGVLIAIVAIILVGSLTKNLIGRSLVRAGERFLESVPFIRSLYKFFRNVFETALQKSARSFKEVALIEYPRPGLWAIAFVIGDAKGEIRAALSSDFDDSVNVFVPTVPNPTSGFLIYLSRAAMKPLAMSIEDAAKLVFSLGLVVPEFDDPADAQRKLEEMAAAAKPARRGFFMKSS